MFFFVPVDANNVVISAHSSDDSSCLVHTEFVSFILQVNFIIFFARCRVWFDLPFLMVYTAWKSENLQDSYRNCPCCGVVCWCLSFHSFANTFWIWLISRFSVNVFIPWKFEFQPYVNSDKGWQLSYLHTAKDGHLMILPSCRSIQVYITVLVSL